VSGQPAAGGDRGYVHVYTGDGKGKTTAAFGLALRAAGHGRHVFVGQFMKGRPSGEINALAGSPLIHVEQFGELAGGGSREAKDERARARGGLDRARLAIASGNYDLVVLDEIDVALALNLLTVADVVQVIGERPRHVELVLTGREAPRPIVELADLVTEMREVKHYYRQGVAARVGIEY
jgi:cob(I)alamin adenosyltransferase